jgi:hypothetical protein
MIGHERAAARSADVHSGPIPSSAMVMTTWADRRQQRREARRQQRSAIAAKLDSPLLADPTCPLPPIPPRAPFPGRAAEQDRTRRSWPRAQSCRRSMR